MLGGDAEAPPTSGDAARRLQVVDAVGRMVAARLLIGTTGNVSVRSDRGILITPTRAAYHRLEPADLVKVEVGVRSPRRPATAPTPSLELPLHLAIYAARPDVGAVVHTHTPFATAWSFLGRPLEPFTEDFAYYQLGTVRPCAGDAGGEALAVAAAAALDDANGVLLARHGVVSVGATLDLAVDRAAAIEHVAQVAWLLDGRTPARS
ncbi:MAG TPA: class II aldolase/adducin family protein [Baekduia sp.]|uniref:class II aldolase/adducin family protein n=1 Tax=Baekduia sp. TaxID=2600305 RepID=UPI002CEE9542|nr:class II aldolase/adducin family protein [Baekduia sp.]HMJ37751.1 class II aldolase/adducin family protein [Baekduia sp.]